MLRPSRQLVILGQLSAGISTPQSYEKQKMQFSYRTINMLIAALKMGILIGLKLLHLIELLFFSYSHWVRFRLCFKLVVIAYNSTQWCILFCVLYILYISM